MARAGDELFNPLTGERIVFRRTAADTEGRLLEMDDLWTLPGHRAPEHVHPGMQERWTVVAGAARFRVGGAELGAGPGDVVTASAGIAHLAWNAGEGPTHVRIEMTPALGWEVFVERLFALAAAAHEAGRDALDAPALLDLMREFPREIALPGSGLRTPVAG